MVTMNERTNERYILCEHVAKQTDFVVHGVSSRKAQVLHFAAGDLTKVVKAPTLVQRHCGPALRLNGVDSGSVKVTDSCGSDSICTAATVVSHH